uniref:Uncharacterized protein n=1 Tax=Cannabis sativa TaxID=3483 RepID=A0A803R620_CANSA
MILQNTSIASLTGAAVASANKASSIWSYVLPLLGILSSLLISLRIKSYTTHLSLSLKMKTPKKVN